MVRGYTSFALFVVLALLASCKDKNDVSFGDPVAPTDQVDSNKPDSNTSFDLNNEIDSSITIVALPDPVIYKQGAEIKTGLTKPDSLVAFSKSLVGTPY